MTWIRSAALMGFACLAFSTGGCSTVIYGTEFQDYGEGTLGLARSAGPEGRDAARRIDSIARSGSGFPEPVRFFGLSAPEGLEIDHGTLSVAPGFDHELVGEIRIAHDGFHPELLDRLQLTLFTFGLYALFFRPFDLLVVPEADAATVRAKMIDEARRVGANAIVFARIETVAKYDGLTLGRGFALRLDPRTKDLPPGRTSDSYPKSGAPSALRLDSVGEP